jgi:hypothetical protein
MLIRRSVAVSMLAVLALTTAACSNNLPGTATSTTTPSDTPSSAPSNPLASIDPCQLLDQNQLTQLSLGAGKPDNTAKARGCQWAKGGSYTVSVYLDGSQPIDAVGSDGASAVTLSSHDAVQTTSSGLGCDVEIAVSKSASVDVIVTSGSGINDCQLAQTYAQMIESKLPAQQR